MENILTPATIRDIKEVRSDVDGGNQGVYVWGVRSGTFRMVTWELSVIAASAMEPRMACGGGTFGHRTQGADYALPVSILLARQIQAECGKPFFFIKRADQIASDKTPSWLSTEAGENLESKQSSSRRTESFGVFPSGSSFMKSGVSVSSDIKEE